MDIHEKLREKTGRAKKNNSISSFFEIQNKVLGYHPNANTEMLKQAYSVATDAHLNQKRANNEPYINHSLGVATILADMKLDDITIAAGLLHDVVEESENTREDIEKIFGKEIGDLVWGVTKMTKLSSVEADNARTGTLIKMILAMTSDLRVILIKLADRFQNLQNLDGFARESRKRLARETLNIYAPIAHRLGLINLKTQMENIAFKHANPDEYENLKNKIGTNKEWAHRQLDRVKKEMLDIMKHYNIEGEILTRYKSEYAIFRKMKRKNISFDNVIDLLGLRIVTDTIENCYMLLGEIHQRWQSIPMQFHDYIANPKPNGYRALITAIISPDGAKFEVQILTHDMNREAETGSAAHWKFQEDRPEAVEDKRLEWYRNIVEATKENPDPREFTRQVKGDLGDAEVYVFTPQGKIINLKQGATPIDFAYAIHTEVGRRFAGARVNEQNVPPETVLNSGDIVEIITKEDAQPTREWLRSVKTKKAKKQIVSYIQNAEKEKPEDIAPFPEMVKELHKTLSKTANIEAGMQQLQMIKYHYPEEAKPLAKELGILYPDHIETAQMPGYWKSEAPAIAWWHRLWITLSERRKLELRESEEAGQDETTGQLQPNPAMQQPGHDLENPEEKGDKLEAAMMELLHEFFRISEINRQTVLNKLRRQGKGTQYGRDLEFDCLLDKEREIQCYIECKNYGGIDSKGKKRFIKLGDISEKLLQTERSNPELHHWILISPYADVSPELNEHLAQWERQERFPFKVQCWTPETGIRELFGLKPDLYDAFGFGDSQTHHPREWSSEKKQQVVEKWQSRLLPPLRLPKGWRNYLSRPAKFLLNHENPSDFNRNYENYIPMTARDEAGLTHLLEEAVRKWLKQPLRDHPTFMLLGEFGDGKSFFTYCLTRKLAQEFIQTGKGWIPVRYSLRQFNSSASGKQQRKSAQTFLKERIERFGADLNGWDEIRENHNILAILDGFDEISTSLDNKTMLENTRILLECWEEFAGIKVLITSRKHFFDTQREKSRLLERIGNPDIFHLVPIEKQVTRNHLKTYAHGIGKTDQFMKIQHLHDPVGLAQKPLFLQMIKETLEDLPESEAIDEMVLYDTYSRRCLRRKIQLLEDSQLKTGREDIVAEMLNILEQVAMKLQETGTNTVYLQDFHESSVTRQWAEALWAITEPDERTEEDAAARVALRSLLKRMPGQDKKRWPVNFCHRSMKEYFAALGVCRLLRKERKQAETFLSTCYLNYEVIYFATRYMNKHLSPVYETILMTLIRLTSQRSGTTHVRGTAVLGCNAVNLLYAYKKELPGNDWSHLLLDNALLPEANLSGKNFSCTSLRYANLDNAILENADFSHADITGVKLEETGEINSIMAPGDPDELVALYEDGNTREWQIDTPIIPHPHILYQLEPVESQTLELLLENPRGYINCLKPNEFLLFKCESQDEKQWRLVSQFPIARGSTVLSLTGDSLLLKHEEKGRQWVHMIDTATMEVVKTTTFKPYTFYRSLGTRGFLVYNEEKGLYVEGMTFKGKNSFQVPRVHELTCMSTYTYPANIHLLGWGQRNGSIHIAEITGDGEYNQYRQILEYSSHKGMVRDIKFINGNKIVSGGSDKKLIILEFDRQANTGEAHPKVRELRLSVRCRGMNIQGLKSKREFLLLKALIKKSARIG